MSHNEVLDEHILSIVQLQEITEQVDLQNSLKDRGFEIPQATLSRKLKKLKIVKVAGRYNAVDFKAATLPLVLNMEVSDFGLIVLHTQPGNASSLAFYMDKKYITASGYKSEFGVLGTIAGDDTVLVIIKSQAYLKNIVASIKSDFPYLNFNNSLEMNAYS